MGPTPSATEALIAKLKSTLQDIIAEDEKFSDDFYLLQWLKCQSMRVNQAEKMIRNSAKWRKQNKYDESLLDEIFPPELTQLLPFRLEGVTKSGVPILSAQLTEMKMKSALDKFGRDLVLRIWAQLALKVEKLMIGFNKKANVHNRNITPHSSRGIMIIIDCRDYSALQFQSFGVVRAYTDIVRMLVSYFPGIYDTLIYINCNKIFHVLFKVFRPLLESPILTLETYDTDQNIWQPALLKHVEPSQLVRAVHM